MWLVDVTPSKKASLAAAAPGDAPGDAPGYAPGYATAGVTAADDAGVAGDGPVSPDERMIVCDESGEDPTCHNSACRLGLCTSVADHLVYLGAHMWAGDEC